MRSNRKKYEGPGEVYTEDRTKLPGSNKKYLYTERRIPSRVFNIVSLSYRIINMAESQPDINPHI